MNINNTNEEAVTQTCTYTACMYKHKWCTMGPPYIYV